MMRLLSGVALAALIAAPVWAQTPTNTPKPNTPAQSAQAPANTQNAPATPEKSKATSGKEAAAKTPAKHREMRHAARHQMRHAMGMPRHRMRYAGGMHRTWWHPSYGMHRYRHWGWYGPHRMYGWGWVHGPTDFMAQQLNRQELGQIYSGGGMPPAQPPGY